MFIVVLRKIFRLELNLFTKYLEAAREGIHPEETTTTRRLDTHQDVNRAYAQQHMPTIPQFYEHVKMKKRRKTKSNHERFVLDSK